MGGSVVIGAVSFLSNTSLAFGQGYNGLWRDGTIIVRLRAHPSLYKSCVLGVVVPSQLMFSAEALRIFIAFGAINPP
jgi:hypothetical protein